MSGYKDDNPPTIYVQTILDLDKWNMAKWRATVYLHDPTGDDYPCLGLGFRNIEAGKEIFRNWLQRFGRVDKYEELRVSIVEGEIPDQDEGYSVIISSNPKNTEERARAEGHSFDYDQVMVLSRICRMNPAPDSPHLSRFKRDYAKHGRYYLIPVFMEADDRYTPFLDLAVGKTEINFRQVSEILSEHDPDSAVLPANYFDNDKSVQ